MNMKNIIKSALIGLAALSLASCGDSFFEQYPANTVTEGNYYKTDDDFNQGVYCCYDKLKTQMGFFINELAYRSDECELTAMVVSTQDRYDLDHFQERSNNAILSNIWNAWYNGIYRCNDVLDHMAGKTLANGDKYRGECLFMRSWWYFSLYRVFGVVPVTRTVVIPVQAKTIPRCTEEEMYNLLVEDLKEAIDLLPAKRSAEVARVTKIAAQALLGKAILEDNRNPILTPELEALAKQVGGHGGMDFIMDYRLIYCLRNGLPLDMDVYDMAEWCCLTELGRISIENGNAPVEVPDFTRGVWDQIQGFSYAFAE